MSEKSYSKVRKTGRCANGIEADGGTRIHVIESRPDNVRGDWFSKSICGTEPGSRGNGWTLDSRKVSCPKCIAKIEKLKIQIS